MATPQRRSAGLGKAPTREHPVAPRDAAPAEEQAPTPPPPPQPTPVSTTPAAPRRTAPRQAPAASSGELATLSGRVPVELRNRVKVYAATHGISVQELLVEAIEDRLSK